MRPWVWVCRKLRAAAWRVWRRVLHHVAAAAALLLFSSFCVYLHLQSLPEKLTATQLLQQHMQRHAAEAAKDLWLSLQALRGPLLEVMRIIGALLIDFSSLFLLWWKVIYPFASVAVAKAVQLYIQLQPQHQLLLAAATAAYPVCYFLHVSERLRRVRASVSSLYCRLTDYVAAGAPLALTLLLQCCCCLLLGASRLSSCLSVLWLPLPLVGSAVFAATNLDALKAFTAAGPAADPTADPAAATLATLSKTDADEAAAAAASVAAAVTTEWRMRALRSLTCWLMLWFLQDIGCILSGLLLLLPLPVSFQVFVQAAPLHLFMAYVLLALLTGGSSSLLLFMYSHKVVRALAATLSLFTRKFIGVELLLRQQQQQEALHRKLLLLAEKQAQHLTAAAAAKGSVKVPTGTLQLANTFRLNEGEVLALHCLSDFSPLEETQQQQQHQAATVSRSFLHSVRSAAVAAFGSSNETGAATQAEGSSSTHWSLFTFRGGRMLLQQMLQQMGITVSPSLVYLIAASLRYAPQLLFLLLPAFLLGPLLLLLLRVWPLAGTLLCLARGGSVSSRLYWLCYFWGAAAAYSMHTQLAQHALLRLLPLQQTRLLLMLWGVQTAAKVLSGVAKLEPLELPSLQQKQQQRLLDTYKQTNRSSSSSSSNTEAAPAAATRRRR